MLLLPALALSVGLSTARAEVLRHEIHSAAEGRVMPYSVYTPPGWDGKSALPVVLFLHGGGDDADALQKHPVAARTLDRWISEGTLPPFLMVVPEGERGFWRNWADGSHRYEDWVLQDVLGDVQTRYGVDTSTQRLHVMGISMGGAGTMMLALSHPDRVASASVLSAPLFTVDQAMKFLDGSIVAMMAPIQQIFGPPNRERVAEHNAYERLKSAEDLHGVDLLIAHGTADMGGIAPSNRTFHEHLEAHGVPHDRIIFQGGHQWSAWSNIYPVALCLRLKGDACELPKRGAYKLDRAKPAEPVAPLTPG